MPSYNPFKTQDKASSASVGTGRKRTPGAIQSQTSSRFNGNPFMSQRKKAKNDRTGYIVVSLDLLMYSWADIYTCVHMHTPCPTLHISKITLHSQNIVSTEP